MFLWPKKKGLITDKFLCELFFIVPIIDHCILKEVGGGGGGVLRQCHAHFFVCFYGQRRMV